MAKTIQIRKVPDEVHHQLKVRAAEAGVSLSDYLLEVIEEVATQPPIADVLRRAAAYPGGASPQAIVDAVRAGRDADWPRDDA